MGQREDVWKRVKNLLKSFLNPVKEVNIGKGTETREKGDMRNAVSRQFPKESQALIY